MFVSDNKKITFNEGNVTAKAVGLKKKSNINNEISFLVDSLYEFKSFYGVTTDGLVVSIDLDE